MRIRIEQRADGIENVKQIQNLTGEADDVESLVMSDT
jgi:hypothetical protein